MKTVHCQIPVDSMTLPDRDAVETPQAKHTPGPWKVTTQYCNPLGQPSFQWEHVQSEKGVCVANPNHAVQEWKANARLIAAAPELLAALKACERQLDRETLGGETLDAARAVIAKATGGAA
jgi:hypothetical protein